MLFLVCGSLLVAALSLFGQTSICPPDATRGELPGVVGWVCAPPCNPDNSCPSNNDVGITATPHCFLQEETHAGTPKFFCGLSCQADHECPSKSCAHVSADTTSLPGDHRVCVHPMSFADWQQNPQDSPPVRFIISAPPIAGNYDFLGKAMAALTAMRMKYGIPESDPDYLVVHAALSTPEMRSSGNTPIHNEPHARDNSLLGSLGGDFRYGEKRFSEGLGGVRRVYGDAMKDITHIGKHNAATDLLHGLVWLFVLYLAIGCLLKYNVQGARGIEMVPHIEFWRESPALVADGVKYLKIIVSQASAKGPTLYSSVDDANRNNPDSFSTFVPA
eukprot:GEMP01039662.1.p1 GENE.GEMP01039662.1~~GEMP01039662.1.p1  ORF type:complete len:332 (+),score=45.60 GEMP01039662.1:75-1070(+)